MGNRVEKTCECKTQDVRQQNKCKYYAVVSALETIISQGVSANFIISEGVLANLLTFLNELFLKNLIPDI